MTPLGFFLRNYILKSFSRVYITHCERLSHICGGFDIIAESLNGSTFETSSNTNVACDVHVTSAKRDTRGSLAYSKTGGVYRRQIRNKLTGEFTGQVKYEPRLKRDKQSLSLGQYDTYDEAKIVYDVALNLYENHEFGYLDFEDGRYLVSGLSSKGSDRYFVIPPLTEKLEGKEKSKLVSFKTKEIYKQFKGKQTEYRKHRDLWLEARGLAFPDMPGIENEVLVQGEYEVHTEENVSGPSEARSFEFTNSPLEQRPSYNDQYVGNLAVEGSVLNNPGMTSNTSSHLGDTIERTPFDASNPSPLSACYEVLESPMDYVPALSGEDSRRKFELPGRHILSYGPTPIVVPDSLPNTAPASGFNFNIGNEVGALLLQVVNTSHQEKQLVQQQLVNTLQQDKQELKQEKQELKRKICELQTQLSELQREYREHILCCSGENRPHKKRGDVCETGELGGA